MGVVPGLEEETAADGQWATHHFTFSIGGLGKQKMYQTQKQVLEGSCPVEAGRMLQTVKMDGLGKPKHAEFPVGLSRKTQETFPLLEA